MNPDIFAEWLRRQSHHVARTTSSYWVEFGPRVYQAFPYHHLINPREEEIKQLLQEQKAIALRYSTFQNAREGSLSYHVVYERRQYVQSDLPKKARHDVKKGLSVARIEPISFERLATDGWGLRRETLARQGRSRAETENDWRKLCRSAKGLTGFEAWGALAQGKLVAALLAFSCDGYFSILYQQSLSEYLRFGVNNALAYEVTSRVLNRPGVMGIFYGLHSLDAPPSVDEFKFRMGYTAKPVRQRVVFHPYVQPLVNPLSHALLKTGRNVFPGNPMLAKAEGIFRFHLQGRLPLTHQTVPTPLRELAFSK
jgi:hypothetical protein